MEENSFEYVSHSESELSTIDEGQYANVPTAEINMIPPQNILPLRITSILIRLTRFKMKSMKRLLLSLSNIYQQIERY